VKRLLLKLSNRKEIFMQASVLRWSSLKAVRGNLFIIDNEPIIDYVKGIVSNTDFV